MPAFHYTMPVRFADVDHAGIVYYPHYYHYFHQAFEELFRDRMGAEAYVRLLDEEKIGFPAVASSCEYKAPLKFGESVAIEVSLARLGERSLTLRYRAFRVREGEGSRVLAAEGQVTSAVVDLTSFRAVALPEQLRQLFLGIAEDTPASP